MRMRRYINRTLALGAFGLALLNVQVAMAHNWWHWHWHTGSDIKVWVGSYLSDVSNKALDEWDLHTDVRFPRSTSHTEMSVFAGNYGNTGWGGLASIEDTAYDWWHYWDYSKITHCHARVNMYYGYNKRTAQGIQCQEIGHCLGLTHSNDGCMGKSYYNNLDYTVPHNWSDVNAKY